MFVGAEKKRRLHRSQNSGSREVPGAMAGITHSCASTCFTVLFVLAGGMLAAVPVASWFYWENYSDRVPAHTLAWLIASCFLGVTLPISLWEIVMHLRYWHMPLLQVPVVRVLWMVPIYAIDSWLALRFSWTKYRSISSYICVARECYEAFVVYNFFLFLARYVAIAAVQDRRRMPRGDADGAPATPGRRASAQPSPESWRPAALNASFDDDAGVQANAPQEVLSPSRLVEEPSEVYSVASGTHSTDGLTNVRAVEARLRGVLARKAPIEHIFPLSHVLRPWATSATAHHDSCEYYRRIKGGVTQYVVVKLGCAMAAFFLKPFNLWGEGTLDPTQVSAHRASSQPNAPHQPSPHSQPPLYARAAGVADRHGPP